MRESPIRIEEARVGLRARRRVLKALAAGAALCVVRPARATPEELAVALKENFGDRPIRAGRVSLEMPRLAENGAVVPVIVSVESPMSETDYVRSIHLFAEGNPLPRVLDVYLGPWSGRASVTTRMRLATTQKVLAVAVLSDDSLWSAAYEVEVTASGCGL